MTGLIRSLGASIFIFVSASSFAQGFIDTTTGNTEESDSAYGINSNEATTKRAQEIMKRFKKGRLSSNKDRNSRYSATLEFHDSNLDGVVDHDTTSDGGLEGGLRGLLKGSGSLEEVAKKAREEANLKSCGDKDGKRNQSSGELTCFNPSSIIVDTGGAHGEDGEHRKYEASDEAQKVIERVAKEYGAKTLEDIQSAYRDAYGKDMPDAHKFAAIHLLRSEGAWLEEQKSSILERQWKLLRAARLANYDYANERVAGEEGAEFMHDIESMMSTGKGDAEIAERIVLNSEMRSQTMLKKENGDWASEAEYAKELGTGPGAADKIKKAKELALEAVKNKLSAEYKKTYGSDIPDNHEVSYKEFSKYANISDSNKSDVKNKLLDFLKSDPSKEMKEKFAKVEKCFDANTWCHTQRSADAANDSKAKGSSSTKTIEPFDVISGDPGNVYKDTRELIYVKLQEAQKVPVNKIESTVTNADFNRKTHPKYFKELDATIAEVKQLQDSDPKNYNLDTMSLQQLTGIRKGLNDTFDDVTDSGVLTDIVKEELARTGGAAASARGPANNQTGVRN